MASTSESTIGLAMSAPSSSIKLNTIGATDEMDSTAQINDKNPEGGTTQDKEVEAAQYVTGVALYSVLTGLTMAAFLLMLDSTIVVTVS